MHELASEVLVSFTIAPKAAGPVPTTSISFAFPRLTISPSSVRLFAGTGFGFPVLHLFRRHDPNEAYINEGADMSGSVHQNYDIKRVSVLTQCGGNEAEV